MSAWHLVSISPKAAGLTLLLVKLDIFPSSYVILATDLNCVWSEKLDRKNIIRRAFDDDTSLDPSDSLEQLQRFLDYLKKAAHGEPGTSVTADRDNQDQPPIIRLTAELPPPLAQFQWTIRLEQEPSDALTEELILPVLASFTQERSAVSFLLNIIKEKDAVISKLRDKLNLSGINLNSVFPGVAQKSSKSANDESLNQSVPGLRGFDHSQWRQSLPENINIASREELCRSLFESDTQPRKGTAGSALPLNSSVIFDSQPANKPPAAPSPNAADEGAPSNAQVSDRQQDTAVEGRRKLSTSSTESEDISGPNRTEDSSNKVAESPVKKRLGRIGGKSKATTAVSGDEHVVSCEDNHMPMASSATTTPQKSRGKLGRIGGRKEDAHPAGAADVSASFEKSLPSREMSSSRKYDGDDEREGREVIAGGGSGSARETSQERADRNRAEIKREMDEKRKVPPKKKRKF